MAAALQRELRPLRDDLAFFLGVVSFTKSYLSQGFCMAEVAPIEERCFAAEGMYQPTDVRSMKKTRCGLVSTHPSPW